MKTRFLNVALPIGVCLVGTGCHGFSGRGLLRRARGISHKEEMKLKHSCQHLRSCSRIGQSNDDMDENLIRIGQPMYPMLVYHKEDLLTYRIWRWVKTLHWRLQGASISWNIDLLFGKDDTSGMKYRRWAPLSLALANTFVWATIISGVLPRVSGTTFRKTVMEAARDFAIGFCYPFKVLETLIWVLLPFSTACALLTLICKKIPENGESGTIKSLTNAGYLASITSTILTMVMDGSLFLVKIPLFLLLSTIYCVRWQFVNRRFNGKIPTAFSDQLQFNLTDDYIDKKQTLWDFCRPILGSQFTTIADIPLAQRVVSIPFTEELSYRFLLDKIWLGLASSTAYIVGMERDMSSHSAFVVFNSIYFGLVHIANYFPLTNERRASFKLQFEKPFRRISGFSIPAYEYKNEMASTAIFHFIACIVYSLLVFNPVYLSRGFFSSFGAHASVNLVVGKVVGFVTGLPDNLAWLCRNWKEVSEEVDRRLNEDEGESP